MRVTWRFLTRQGLCPPLIALLLTCSVAACATPFSNKDTPLAQNTPIVYALIRGDGSLQAISGRDGSPLWHTAVGDIGSAPIIVGDTVYALVFSVKRLRFRSRCAPERRQTPLADPSTLQWQQSASVTAMARTSSLIVGKQDSPGSIHPTARSAGASKSKPLVVACCIAASITSTCRAIRTVPVGRPQPSPPTAPVMASSYGRSAATIEFNSPCEREHAIHEYR